MTVTSFAGCLVLIMMVGAGAAEAQSTTPVQLAPANAPSGALKASTGGPAPLVVLFESGSSKLRPEDRDTLDRAARAYNEGRPIVMILTGSSDTVGNAQHNLSLSEQRASAVLHGLLDRGIPAEHFQVFAKGETELPVPTRNGVPEGRNRSVAISWH